jgi:hypothetical protein
MGRFFNSIKVFFTYWVNLLVWNKEGWYIGEPSADAQGFRAMTKQKVYRQHTCKVCKRDFWSYKKPDTCFRMECYINWNTRSKNATNTCKN